MFFLIRTAGRSSRGGTARPGSWLAGWLLCFALAVPIAGIAALFHAVDHHAPPAPIAQLVTFNQGSLTVTGRHRLRWTPQRQRRTGHGAFGDRGIRQRSDRAGNRHGD